MEHEAVYLLFCKFTLHVSDVNHTQHQPLQRDSSCCHVGGRQLHKKYDQYRRL